MICSMSYQGFAASRREMMKHYSAREKAVLIKHQHEIWPETFRL